MNRNVGRQLSLRCETPTLKSRRSSLRRQLSEDEERAPPRVKLAWTTSAEDVEDQKNKKDEQHCKNGADASILYPHLAERLRHVWQDKRTNLNIVLGAGESPKINDSLQPELMMIQQRPQKDLKQIFQKQIRKNARTPPPPHPQERPIVVVPIIERPKTATTVAATRREQFQKRTSSAFSVSLKQEQIRPPLTRSSSLPTKNESKTKFPANKKRPKSTKRKDSISDSSKPPDVITMVSLVSPSGSDNEEETQKGDGSNAIKIKVPLTSDQKVSSSTHRKTVKSVSFQQAGVVHAVRSFSAGLPLRRGSLATTTLLLGNAAKKLINRSQQDNISKRDCDDKQREQRHQQLEESQISADPNANVIVNRKLPRDDDDDENFEKKVVVVVEDCPKEKECWDTYCKMNAKGVSVSFDTILRGMLTPTEYRLRRKQVEAQSLQDF